MAVGGEGNASTELNADAVGAGDSTVSMGPRVLTPEMESIIARVSSSGRTIRSQQRGEPSLTEGQRAEILSDFLCRRPEEFLNRYGSILVENNLKYFDGLEPGYELGYRIQELRKHLDPRVRQKKVRNRRFEYMKEMMEKTQYFSEEEMRNRNPLLYERLVGQYEPCEGGDRKSDMTLSGLILQSMEADRRRQLLQQQRDHEEVEEMDSSSEEEEEDEESPLEPERLKLREEFLREMQQSFLNGEDAGFDYSKVDGNDRYDSIEQRERDEQESYFDSEEPSWCGAEVMDSTDEYDYMSDRYLYPNTS